MNWRRLFAALITAVGLSGAVGAHATSLPSVHVFWATGCPHCAGEKAFLPSLAEKYPGLAVHDYEVSASQDNAVLFARTGQALGANFSGVPVTVVGGRYVMGFRDAGTSGRAIEDMITAVMASGEADVVAGIISPGTAGGAVLAPPPSGLVGQGEPDEPPLGEASAEESASGQGAEKQPDERPDNAPVRNGTQGVPEEVSLPLVGKIRLTDASLPIFTVVMALLDGFNPCAMWVMLFLLSLLVGMPDRKRAWVLGASFVAASALMYFLFLAAWLQVFLFLGFVFWIRMVVGTVALAAGAYYLRDFLVNRRGGCGVVSDSLRNRIFSRAREAIGQKSLLLGVVGIVALAFAVNLVELVCSAGLPAVYTHVLSANHLAAWQHYAYLALYILVFLIDDLFVFFTAMIFLQLTGIQHKYTRCARFVGGLLMLVIGLLLFFRPEWLTFG
jgi:glutaredoxin